MTAFDPFANQGGPAAWDPAHDDNSRELAEKLLRAVPDEERPIDPDFVEEHPPPPNDERIVDLDADGWAEPGFTD